MPMTYQNVDQISSWTDPSTKLPAFEATNSMYLGSAISFVFISSSAARSSYRTDHAREPICLRHLYGE